MRKIARLVPKRTASGKRSKFEEACLQSLDARGAAYEYENKKLPYVLNYLVDVELANGIIIEYKGYFPPEERTKMLAVKRANPDADIRFVFMRPGNRINTGSPTTYAAWAEKHGFPWAEGDVPDEWLLEPIKRCPSCT